MKKRKLELSRKLFLNKEQITSLSNAQSGKIAGGINQPGTGPIKEKTNNTNCPYTQQYMDCITHRMADCPSVLCTVPEDNVSLCTMCKGA